MIIYFEAQCFFKFWFLWFQTLYLVDLTVKKRISVVPFKCRKVDSWLRPPAYVLILVPYVC
jgi:hypothetical protein